MIKLRTNEYRLVCRIQQNQALEESYDAAAVYLHQLVDNPVTSVGVVKQAGSVCTTSDLISINICTERRHFLHAET